AHDALELRRQGSHRAARALVAGVGLELDPDATERLEGVRHLQQFGFDIYPAAPDPWVKPGPADLDHLVGRAHVEEATAADQLAAAQRADREDALAILAARIQRGLEPAVEQLAARVEADQPGPDLIRLGRLPEALGVLGLERLEGHPLAPQRHRQRSGEPAAHSPIALITTRFG